MAVTMADITKLRKMTGAGMMDCKNALTEADGDYDKAMEIIRKKGQAVAAKRSEREASEGCVLAKTTGDYAVVIALKCETDFVAQNADFVKLTQDILDLAVANKCKTLDEVKALPMGNGTVQDAVVDRSGITGEKMELDGYMTVEGASTAVYNHMNRNGLCTIVAFNKNVDEQLAKQVAMQIAAMNPIAIDEDGVSEEVKEKEIAVAIEKTKAEQVQKAVEAALKKANINPAHVQCHHGPVCRWCRLFSCTDRFYSDGQELRLYVYHRTGRTQECDTGRSKQGRSGWSGHPYDKVRRGASVGRK